MKSAFIRIPVAAYSVCPYCYFKVSIYEQLDADEVRDVLDGKDIGACVKCIKCCDYYNIEGSEFTCS